MRKLLHIFDNVRAGAPVQENDMEFGKAVNKRSTKRAVLHELSNARREAAATRPSNFATCQASAVASTRFTRKSKVFGNQFAGVPVFRGRDRYVVIQNN